MRQFYRSLLLTVLILTLGALFCLTPSAVSSLPQWWTKYLPVPKIRLGLDLRGGTHLLLSVDLEKALETALDQSVEELRRELREEGIAIIGVEHKDDVVQLSSVSQQKRGEVERIITDRFPNLSLVPRENGKSQRIRLSLSRQEERRIREYALDQSLETIRNRVDQFGVAEPIIQRQGDREIIVQLPGIQDPERAKSIIGRTALLEFKLVAEGFQEEQVSEGNLTGDTQILYGTDTDPLSGVTSRVSYVLERKTLMTGDVVANARPRPGAQFEGPYVELMLNDRGARVFEEITSDNVGRRLAIILDNTVYSAPVIRERIGGGRASITGRFDFRESRDLAIVLRAGALPAPVTIVEERTVGPSLGRDSIRQGVISFIVGGVFVVVFMVVYYKLAGVLADLALILNMIYLLAFLAVFGATLTLPGIAGIVLTMGMAVDANVLISERMREESRLGKGARAALESGYERALPAILDSNITTFLSGLILFQFGTGPVKGFAVTLCTGIVSSVVTAVVVTRIIYEYLLSTRRVNEISV